MAKKKQRLAAKAASMSMLMAKQDALIQSIADILFRSAKQNALLAMGDENCWDFGVFVFSKSNVVSCLFYHEQYFDYQFFDDFNRLLMAVREFKKLTCAHSHKPWITCQFAIANQGGRFKIIYDYEDKKHSFDRKPLSEIFFDSVYETA